jgi:hypothetical protein
MIRAVGHFLVVLCLLATVGVGAISCRSVSSSDFLVICRDDTSYVFRTWKGTFFFQKEPQTRDPWFAEYMVFEADGPSPIPDWSWSHSANEIELSLRAWLPQLFFSLLPILAATATFLRRLRLRRRARQKRCLSCNYDLRSTPDRCPECGHEVSSPLPTLPFRTIILNLLTCASFCLFLLTTALWALSHHQPLLLVRADGRRLSSLTSSPGHLSFRRFGSFDSDLNEAHLYAEPTSSLWSDTPSHTFPGLRTFTGFPRKARLYHTILPYAGFSISYWLLTLLFALLPLSRLISPRSTPHQ